MHLVGFIIRNFVTMHGHMNVRKMGKCHLNFISNYFFLIFILFPYLLSLYLLLTYFPPFLALI
jgi:hypothetical protein